MGSKTDDLIKAALKAVKEIDSPQKTLERNYNELLKKLKKEKRKKPEAQELFDVKLNGGINVVVNRIENAIKHIEDLDKKIKSKSWKDFFKEQKSLDAAKQTSKTCKSVLNKYIDDYNAISKATKHDRKYKKVK